MVEKRMKTVFPNVHVLSSCLHGASPTPTPPPDPHAPPRTPHSQPAHVFSALRRCLRIGDRRVLLNKADTIDTQQLMRVYGALMWSLGKVMQTPEVCRVYIGSFWEAPLSNFENRFLLEVCMCEGGSIHGVCEG